MADQTILGLGVTRQAEILGRLNDDGPRAGAYTSNPRTSQPRALSSSNVQCGVWECTPGGWEIENRVGTETMVILFGRNRITTRGAAPVEVGAR